MILHHLDLVRYFLTSHNPSINFAAHSDKLHSCLSLSWSGSSVPIGYREVGFYWLLQCNLLGERLVTLGLAGAGYLRSANPGDSTHNPHEHNLTASPYTPIFLPLPFPLSAIFALSFYRCHPMFFTMFWIRIGFTSNLDPAFVSVRIRIKRAKPMRIHVGQDPAPDPGQILVTKVEFIWKK